MDYRPIRISDMIKNINRDYYLPAIQRELVWGPERIEKLFDSIMGDYPIGSFLFWKVQEKNKDQWVIYEFTRNYDKDNPHNNEANLKGNKDISLVLDGQQRITAIYIGLKGSYRYKHYKWRTTKLYLNLLKKPNIDVEDPEKLIYEFKFRENDYSDDNQKELWYEVGKILNFEDAEEAKDDIKNIIAHLPEELKGDANKLVGKLHNKIHTASVINYYEETSQSYDKVLTIFVRANSAGVSLEYSDLLLSIATAKWKNLNARKEIYEFTDNINEIGSEYNFGKDFVLKGCLYLTEELPIQYKVDNFNIKNLLKIENNWEKIKTYISTTVRLISKYGFSSKNIVAPLALLPIAFFLFKKENKSFDNSSYKNDLNIQIEIRKWLILVLLKNAFGSSTDTKLKNIRNGILELSNYDTFPIARINKELDIDIKLSEIEIESILDIQYKEKYTFLVLSLLYPDKDWKDAVFHEDHIFPQAEFQKKELKKRGYSNDKIEFYMSNYNKISNLQLLTDSENLSKGKQPFNSWLETRDDKFKERHHIPKLNNYGLSSFKDFIIYRKEIIRNMLGKI